MSSQTIEKIFVGVLLAFITAIINQVVSGQINYLWVGSVFTLALFLYWIFQGIGFPYIKFRVSSTNDGKGLLFRSDISTGKKVGEAWQFKADKFDWAVYGPYLRSPLRSGKYRGTFRIKVDDVSGDNRPIIEIDVASRCKEVGDKKLSARTLSTRDFKNADEYQDFPLDFFIISDENDLELRVFTKGSGHTVTLDYIQLTRRVM